MSSEKRSKNLVVVSGAPAAGKSTVAAALGSALGWPVLSLDTIKEALADVLGVADKEWSNQLGDAAAEVVFRLSAQFPDAVAEGWWRRDRRDRALVEFAGATEVFCYCDPRTAADRAVSRLTRGRHPIHRDMISSAGLGEVTAELAASVVPLELGAALVRVNTDRDGAAADAVAEVAGIVGVRLRGLN
jgi:predicted kinase